VFTGYHNAGHFDFVQATYSVGPLLGAMMVNITLSRGYVPYASPASVTVRAANADSTQLNAVNPRRPMQFAEDGVDFTGGDYMVAFGPNVYSVQLSIPVQLRQYAQARAGPSDDRSFGLTVANVSPLHGTGTFSDVPASCRILALCELLGPGCKFDSGNYTRTVN